MPLFAGASPVLRSPFTSRHQTTQQQKQAADDVVVLLITHRNLCHYQPAMEQSVSVKRKLPVETAVKNRRKVADYNKPLVVSTLEHAGRSLCAPNARVVCVFVSVSKSFIDYICQKTRTLTASTLPLIAIKLLWYFSSVCFRWLNFVGPPFI